MEYANNCLEQWWVHAPSSVGEHELKDIHEILNLFVSVRYSCEDLAYKSLPEKRNPRTRAFIPDLQTSFDKYIVIDVLRLLKDQCHEALRNPSGSVCKRVIGSTLKDAAGTAFGLLPSFMPYLLCTCKGGCSDVPATKGNELVLCIPERPSTQ